MYGYFYSDGAYPTTGTPGWPYRLILGVMFTSSGQPTVLTAVRNIFSGQVELSNCYLYTNKKFMTVFSIQYTLSL